MTKHHIMKETHSHKKKNLCSHKAKSLKILRFYVKQMLEVECTWNGIFPMNKLITAYV